MEKILIQKLSLEIKVQDMSDCSNEAKLSAFIDNLVNILDMCVIAPLRIISVPMSSDYVDHHGKRPKHDDEGITGLLAISESHVAFHTWTKLRVIYVEVTSCKKFDVRSARDLALKYFKGSSILLREDEHYLE